MNNQPLYKELLSFLQDKYGKEVWAVEAIAVDDEHNKGLGWAVYCSCEKKAKKIPTEWKKMQLYSYFCEKPTTF